MFETRFMYDPSGAVLSDESWYEAGDQDRHEERIDQPRWAEDKAVLRRNLAEVQGVAARLIAGIDAAEHEE